jgi:predicted amidophosphoribosyltransferase
MRRWAAKAGGVPSDALVMPVPLHVARERQRGFNQAGMLAEAAASALGLRHASGLLIRRRATGYQTSARDRLANVAGAFACRPLPEAVRGRPVLLVDDVVTSGSTMGECAAALRRAGAGPVRGLALAWGDGLPNGPENP